MSLLRSTTTLRMRLVPAARPLCLRYSSTASDPIVLPRLQSDLKTALRSKNKPALTVIRAIQAEITNASKTAKPIDTDGMLYSVIQKQIKGSNNALAEFQAAKRDDLVQKEQAQLDVLQKYADEIPKVESSEIDSLIAEAIQGLQEAKRTFGAVMGKVVGGIKGRPVDMDYVSKKIEELVGKK